MNGSKRLEQLEHFYEDIVGDYCFEKAQEVDDTKDYMDSDDFREYAENWLTERGE